MIRVNLLPVKRKKKPKAVPSFIITGVLVSVAAIIVSGYLFWFLNSQVSALRQQKKDNETKIADLKVKIKEVENYEQQKNNLEQRKKVILDLRKNQFVPVKILAEMASIIPPGVWLESMSITGNSINISGTGFTNEDIVNYVENLKKSQLLTEINLQGTQRAEAGKIITYKFTLTCKVQA